MRRRDLLLLILVASPVFAEQRAKLTKKQCAAIRRRIGKLDSKLRDGHTARQGRSLKRQRRELQLQRYRGCR